MVLEPKDFRQLPCDKQLHPLTILFIARRTSESLWTNRKMSPSYFKLRRFFEKLYDDESPQFVNMLYESLWYEPRQIMTITEFIRESYARRQRLIDEKIKEATTRKNEKVTIEDVFK